MRIPGINALFRNPVIALVVDGTTLGGAAYLAAERGAVPERMGLRFAVVEGLRKAGMNGWPRQQTKDTSGQDREGRS